MFKQMFRKTVSLLGKGTGLLGVSVASEYFSSNKKKFIYLNW